MPPFQIILADEQQPEWRNAWLKRIVPTHTMGQITTEIISTAKQVGDLVDWLIFRHAPPEPYEPTMYIDLEGKNLCREGSLSIFTLLIDTGTSTSRVCLIDVFSLGMQAFQTTGVKGKTLKDVLQNENIPKVFFDARNDSDVLFAHFGVAIQGVQDVQLMESAARKTTRSRKYLNGLAKCVEQYAPDRTNLASWKLAKEKGATLFNPEHGGSYKAFEQRPIPSEIISYCVGDVQHLPKLWERFRAHTNRWRDLVNSETKQRVLESQKVEYQPHGPGRTLAPWSADQNRTLDEWNESAPGNYSGNVAGWDFEGNNNWDDDDGPTSCRDIISDWDYDYYYSD